MRWGARVMVCWHGSLCGVVAHSDLAGVMRIGLSLCAQRLTLCRRCCICAWIEACCHSWRGTLLRAGASSVDILAGHYTRHANYWNMVWDMRVVHARHSLWVSYWDRLLPDIVSAGWSFGVLIQFGCAQVLCVLCGVRCFREAVHERPQVH